MTKQEVDSEAIKRVANQEREAILKAVAAREPDLRLDTYFETVALWRVSRPWLTLLDDYLDAGAIIRMLDAMELKGWVVACQRKVILTNARDGYDGWAGGYEVRYQHLKTKLPLVQFAFGSTRAEAVAKAFVACFQKAAQTGYTEAAEPTPHEVEKSEK